MLVYRRATTKDGASGPAGRWWTTDNGRLAVLDLKVGNGGALTGSVAVCGETEYKIAEGTSTGRSVTFKTSGKSGGDTVTHVWNGELTDETLRLSLPFPSPCAYSPSTTLAFTRAR
jgi:hypothetical protein